MDIQKGDIIAVHGDGLIPLGIEAVSHSPISHVAIVADVEKGLLIEAQGGRAVGYANLSDYKGSSLILRVPNLTAEQKDVIVNYAKSQFGKTYDYVEIFHQFERYVLGVPDKHTEHEKLICSTLVSQAYKKAGVWLTDVLLPSPDDIYKSIKTDVIGRY